MAKPIDFPQTNITYTLQDPDRPDHPLEGRNLPARRINTDDGLAIETHWQPDEGEQRAIANGAPIQLILWGTQHPPAAITAGEPDPQGSGVLLGAHVNRALGLLFAELADRSGHAGRGRITLRTNHTLNPDKFIDLWHRCLQATTTTRMAALPDDDNPTDT